MNEVGCTVPFICGCIEICRYRERRAEKSVAGMGTVTIGDWKVGWEKPPDKRGSSFGWGAAGGCCVEGADEAKVEAED